MNRHHLNPVGTWRVEVTAVPNSSLASGESLEGRISEGLIVFQPDCTLLSLVAGPGAGSWRAAGDSVAFGFRELLGYRPEGRFAGHAVVSQQGALAAGGDAFSSRGQGVLYGADGSHIATTRTTVHASRVS